MNIINIQKHQLNIPIPLDILCSLAIEHIGICSHPAPGIEDDHLLRATVVLHRQVLEQPFVLVAALAHCPHEALRGTE